jgi:hypothetical protein
MQFIARKCLLALMTFALNNVEVQSTKMEYAMLEQNCAPRKS